MRLTGGFMRPAVDGSSAAHEQNPEAVAAFRRYCPGVSVNAQRTDSGDRHPILGPVLGLWAAHANDPHTRFRGSSGGVLTALAQWLIASGQQTRVIGAQGNPDRPSRTDSVVKESGDSTIELSGSRYAPCSNASVPALRDPDTTFIGKPCEASAVREIYRDRDDQPLILSFFCAGTPNQDATDRLLAQLDAPEPLSDMWYRGHGWPGRFTAIRKDGTTATMSYSDSWGGALGPTVQWRCRLCPDGVGEYADVVAGDFWSATPDGYPDFTEGEGTSAVVARTPRGLAIVEAAIREQVITAAPVEAQAITAVQPYQRDRRSFLVPRMAATLALGQPVPRARGYGLLRMAVRRPKESWRQFVGTVGRLRRLLGIRWPWQSGMAGPK